MEIELEAEQPPGRIVVLLLEYGPEQEVVRLFELFGNLFDRIEKRRPDLSNQELALLRETKAKKPPTACSPLAGLAS